MTSCWHVVVTSDAIYGAQCRGLVRSTEDMASVASVAHAAHQSQQAFMSPDNYRHTVAVCACTKEARTLFPMHPMKALGSVVLYQCRTSHGRACICCAPARQAEEIDVRSLLRHLRLHSIPLAVSL